VDPVEIVDADVDTCLPGHHRQLRYASATGKQLVTLIEENLTARRILTRDAFENAAVGGSTNALLHRTAP
jgi:dihydroxyacid dehydratase/phosphogluconate dehydratase